MVTTTTPNGSTTHGQSLRQRIPVASHAQWKPERRQRDPLEILAEADPGRLRELVPLRYGRMMQSPFSFYRGSAAVMAADLAHTPSTGICVQLSGDAHVGNFGGIATPERNVSFEINDFDETLPGPWEWDLKRLAASFVIAMRENGIQNDVARDVAIACARNYRKAIRTFAEMNPLDLWYRRYDAEEFFEGISDDNIRKRVRHRVNKSAARRGSDMVYPKLTHVIAGQTTIKDTPPTIFHPAHSLAPTFRADAERILQSYRETLPDERRVLFDRYRLVDAAIKVVGVGSVGTRCWIVLLMSEQNAPLFLQLKESSASVLEPYAGKSAYRHSGQRIVVGMRLVQAASDVFLGWTSGPNGDFYVRQLRDVKVKPLVELFDLRMFSIFSKACGQNLARGHARSGDSRAIAAYLEKDERFDDAIGAFSVAYADQAERDHAALRRAVKLGKIDAYTE
ncbi:MAG: DUF2252 domain-containing protein [Vulcanimicrobiaceae bacterium]